MLSLNLIRNKWRKKFNKTRYQSKVIYLWDIMELGVGEVSTKKNRFRPTSDSIIQRIIKIKLNILMNRQQLACNRPSKVRQA